MGTSSPPPRPAAPPPPAPVPPPPPPPAPEPPPPPPTPVTAEVVSAKKRAQSSGQTSKGRRSTILTDTQGLLSPAPGNKKTLLGA